MGLPTQTVSLHPDQVVELERHLSDARHGINNHLTLISTAIELIRRDPSAAERLAHTMVDRPQLIREELMRFNRAFDEAFGITRQ
ncbi:MAG: hypothetical protein KJ072_08550 [Verrucomicrobia bacterium]|nr:hypothetical protein [Verrucomicrobiota bacterium]